MSVPRLYIFDLDGTLYRGREPLPHAPEVLAQLRRRGAEIRFLTNNSSQHRELLLLKLYDAGIRAETREVWSSAMGAARLLPELGISSAFVVGETGLRATLEEAGIQLDGPDAECVVAGICRQFDYDWLDRALQRLLGGARFVATNRDATYPLEKGRVEPGAGAIVAAIEAASGLQPIVVGKPETYLIELICREAGIPPAETLVVGDRYDTDIVAGLRAGCQTFQVLTGVSAEAPAGQRSGPDLRGLLDRAT